jgi:hypothetical protein
MICMKSHMPPVSLGLRCSDMIIPASGGKVLRKEAGESLAWWVVRLVGPLGNAHGPAAGSFIASYAGTDAAGMNAATGWLVPFLGSSGVHWCSIWGPPLFA